MNSLPKHSLRLFASPTLSATDGSPLTGRAIQRHRLALLALLARAPDGEVSRDLLLAMLWPETDTDRARNLLNVSVYVLRQALGDESIQSTATGLRLSHSGLDVDVLDFEAALREGALDHAVEIYQGPFMDGFFLRDAPEFGHWIDRERDRLSVQYANALEALAEESEAKGSAAGAVEYWRTLAGHDPYDSRVALRLMQALVASGSRAGALKQARIHEQLLRDAVGIAPPPEIGAFIETLRLDAPSSGSERAPPPPRPVGSASPTGTVAHPAASPGGAVLPAEALAAAADPASLPANSPVGDASRHASHTDDRLEAVASGSPVSLRVSRRTLVASALIAAGLAGATYLARPGQTPAAPGRPSLAVLPLVARGGDPRDGVLADGMTDELITELARAGLRVIARTSVFALRGQPGDVRGIAGDLGVSHVLEGEWLPATGDLRVRLRLVDGSDGSVRWSADFQRPLEDLFDVRHEIARAVAVELGAVPDTAARVIRRHPPTASVVAWELYQQSIRPEVLRSDSAAETATRLLSRAIELDPGFAAAHAGLARLILRAGLPDRPDLSSADQLTLARRSAERAAELDGTLAEAHAALGLTHMALYDLGSAERHFLRAIELDPSDSQAGQWLGRLHIFQGRYREALERVQLAFVVDPLSPTARAELARALLVNGRCDEALPHLAALSELRPPLLRAGPIAAQCHALAGRWAEALAAVQPGAANSGVQRSALIVHYTARSGRVDEANRALQELIANEVLMDGSALWGAVMHLGVGRMDDAFLWLNRAVDDYSLDATIMEPMFAEMRTDPRFDAIRVRLGIGRR